MHQNRAWLMKFLLAILRIPCEVEHGTLILNPKNISSAKMLRDWLSAPQKFTGIHGMVIVSGVVGLKFIFEAPSSGVHRDFSWTIYGCIGALFISGGLSLIWLRQSIKSMISSDDLASEKFESKEAIQSAIIRPDIKPAFILDGVSYYNRSDIQSSSLLRASSASEQPNHQLLHPTQKPSVIEPHHLLRHSERDEVRTKPHIATNENEIPYEQKSV